MAAIRVCAMILAIACLAAPVLGSHASAQAVPASVAASFDRAAAERDLAAIMARERIPGVQVIVLAPEGVAWRKALGFADLGSKRPMTFATLVQIGSITKVFTATLAADLVARGELSWGDTLGELLPDLRLRGDLARISLADLASHQSRLPGNPPNRVDVEGVWRPYGREELHAALADPRLELADTDVNYSNFGFAILGHIVERKSGRPFEVLLRERIFAPLAMNDSRIDLRPQDEARLATHYWPEDRPLRPRPRWTFGPVAGFGGITSTADDLAKFLRFQMDPKAGPAGFDGDSILRMRTIRAMLPNGRIGFGRPWVQRRGSDGTLLIEHGGEVDGHSAMIAFSPAQGVGVVVLANLGQSAADDIARPLLARALAAARKAPRSRDSAVQLFDTRQWADSEAAFAALLADRPGDGDGWYRLGRARYEMRDLAGARTALEKAATLPEPAQQLHFYLAAVAAAQGRNDDALSILKRGVAAGLIDPEELETPEFRALHSHPDWVSAIRGAAPAG